jgi:hypothetical protein
MTKEFFERGKQIAEWADKTMTAEEIEELRFLLILSKMKENDKLADVLADVHRISLNLNRLCTLK